jgi:hypothetical protein
VSTVTQQQFDALVERHLAALADGEARPDADEYADMVRVWNTIQWRGGATGPAAEFSARFYPAEVDTVVSALGMVLSKGMAWYSPAHDLYFGGTPHENSVYEISGP